MHRIRMTVVAAAMIAGVLWAASSAADWDAGLELYREGRFADAMGHFHATVTEHPEWADGYLMLGRCQLALQQFDEALESLRRAVELRPGDAAVVVTLSRALMAVGRHVEAREHLEALDLGDTNPAWKVEASRMLAHILIVEGRADDAVSVLEERLAEFPESAPLHQAIAGAYQATGDRAAALDHFIRALAINPGDFVSARGAATSALALAEAAGDDAAAARSYRRAFEMADRLATDAPGYDHTLLAGQAALGVGDLQAAAGWFTAAVESRPREPVAHFHLARTLAALDHADQAIFHLRTALGAAPDDELAERIHNQLGRLLACRLELDEAARHYRAAGDAGRAAEIEVIGAGFSHAIVRLADLRRDVAALTGMEAELKDLGDADGVAALAGRRQAMVREIEAIEGNLAEVRAALCR